ncbi:MAG TPA: AAA family ATPase [Devosia sp.]|nr:AAA family ATPase [Devosia sp.]
MPQFPPLETFGPRMVICGPSNAGKSTLATALSRRLGVPAIHLDQLHHVPGSDWTPRPREEFVALHDAAVAAEGWVMDGNYSALFPTRLARATGIILLRSDRFSSLARYLRRTLWERNRPGGLAGDRDSLKWKMIHWITIAAPPRQAALRRDLRAVGHPYLELRNMRELNQLYAAWALTRG